MAKADFDGVWGRSMTETETTEARFALNSSPSHLLHRAQQLAANQSSDALKAANITLRQFSLLAAVAEREGASQSQLVDKTGIDRSTLADMVARMETADLVKRLESKEDARAKAVWLTPKGADTLEAAAPAVQAADDELMRKLPKNRRASFLAILAVLADASDREILQLELDDAGEKTKVKTKKSDEKPKKAKADQKPKKAKSAKAAKGGKSAKKGGKKGDKKK